MAGRTTKKWKNADLHRPIQVTYAQGLLDNKRDEKNEKIIRAAIETQFTKLELLFDEYRLPKGAWQMLAYQLASDFVPGMAISEKRDGRPKMWRDFDLAELKIAIDEEIEKHPTWQITDAANHLSKQSPWKEKLTNKTKPAEILRRNYYKAHSGWVEILKKSRLYKDMIATPVKKPR
jgi:hypothetical protein